MTPLKKPLVEEEKFNFLYEDENDYYFINQKSFEQINIKKNLVGDKGKTFYRKSRSNC